MSTDPFDNLDACTQIEDDNPEALAGNQVDFNPDDDGPELFDRIAIDDERPASGETD